MTRLPLKTSLFLGFCAVFILFFRAVLRLHLQVSGHAMFFTVFFLFTARGCVRYRPAATFTGLLAGLGALALGLGKAGPLVLTKFVLPGLMIDLGALLLPNLFQSYFQCALIASLASSTKFLDTYVLDWLIGMDRGVMLRHASLEAGTALLFGLAAGLLVVPVIRQLKAHGLVSGDKVKTAVKSKPKRSS
jgi:hypothetical protein